MKNNKYNLAERKFPYPGHICRKFTTFGNHAWKQQQYNLFPVSITVPFTIKKRVRYCICLDDSTFPLVFFIYSTCLRACLVLAYYCIIILTLTSCNIEERTNS